MCVLWAYTYAAGLWLADAARPGALSRHRVFGVVPRWPLARLGPTMHSASLKKLKKTQKSALLGVI